MAKLDVFFEKSLRSIRPYFVSTTVLSVEQNQCRFLFALHGVARRSGRCQLTHLHEPAVPENERSCHRFFCLKQVDVDSSFLKNNVFGKTDDNICLTTCFWDMFGHKDVEHVGLKV